MRHALAFIGSLVVLVLVMWLYDILFGLPVSDEEPWDPPLCCCSWTFLWLGFVMLPVSAAAESFLIGRLEWRWWAHVPTVAAAFFGLTFTLMMASSLALGIGPSDPYGFNLTSIFVLALLYSLWGTIYWSFLRAGSNLMKVTIGKE